MKSDLHINGMDLAMIRDAAISAEAVLKSSPGGNVNPLALTEIRAQLSIASAFGPPFSTVAAYALELATRLYSESGWVELGSQDQVAAALKTNLARLRWEAEHLQRDR